MDTPRLTAMAERTGLRKSIYVDPIEEDGEDSNRPASKRRCGVDRVNDYDTGCAIDDAATPFSEGTPLHRWFAWEQ